MTPTAPPFDLTDEILGLISGIKAGPTAFRRDPWFLSSAVWHRSIVRW